MKAIIPVAGAGTRLRPHTYTTPKVLLPVAGRPMIGHILEQLEGLPIDRTVMVVGQMGEKVRQYVDGSFKLPVDYLVQPVAGGLAQAIMLTREAVGDDDALIILGDTVFETDFRAILSKQSSQIGVKEVDDPRRFGVVEHRDGRITRLVEKPDHPKTNLAIVGIYLIREMPRLYQAIDRLMAQGIKTRGEYQLTDALQLMIESGCRMEAFPVEGWYDCGKPETLLETNRVLLDKGRGAIAELPGVVINHPVFIDPAARIERSVIGPHVSVSAGACILNSLVSDSIIGPGAVLDSAILTRSLVGEKALVKGRPRSVSLGDCSQDECH